MSEKPDVTTSVFAQPVFVRMTETAKQAHDQTERWSVAIYGATVDKVMDDIDRWKERRDEMRKKWESEAEAEKEALRPGRFGDPDEPLPELTAFASAGNGNGKE